MGLLCSATVTNSTVQKKSRSLTEELCKSILMEEEAAGNSVPAGKTAASKIIRVALGVFVSSTVVLGIALFLGKFQCWE